MKTKVRKSLLMAAIGLMAAAGCEQAKDGSESAAAVKSAVDIPAMKAAALSNIASSTRVGNGCVADMTIDSAMQRIVSETLCRHADTNDTGVGWAILMSVKDGAVLALADCGGDANAPRPFALTRQFMPGHLLSTLTVAAALDAGIAQPDTELSTYGMFDFLNAISGIWMSRNG